jgi:hypothetical protein
MRKPARKTAREADARRAGRAAPPADPADHARADARGTAGTGERPEEPRRGVAESIVDELFKRMSELASQPAGRLSGILLTEFLEGPAMVLRSYQRALEECSPGASPEDQARHIARAMMGTYLELATRVPEQRERLLVAHSLFVKICLDAIESLQRRLAGPAA